MTKELVLLNSLVCLEYLVSIVEVWLSGTIILTKRTCKIIEISERICFILIDDIPSRLEWQVVNKYVRGEITIIFIEYIGINKDLLRQW